MNINIQPISNVIGVLLVLVSLMMYSCLLFCWLGDSPNFMPMTKAGTLTLLVGLIIWRYKFKSENTIQKKEGFLIVFIAWFSISIFAALPYVFTDTSVSLTNALFESVSGLTTTGATIFENIEALSPDLLMWRSITQWIGGMGIIVLTVAIFPLLGIAGIELFVAEAPGPTSDKIHPRIRETAKRLWLIYITLTMILFLVLRLEGMSWFDSINHAFTTMATGGFSTKTSSIAFFNSPAIEYTIIFFMFLAGTNYSVTYLMIKGNFKIAFRNEEYRLYITMILFLTIVIGLGIMYHSGMNPEESFRTGLFQIVSIITTTGFITADYTIWSSWLYILFFILLFAGACAGSTSGGIKLIRHLVLFKNTNLEFKRLLHPNAMIRVKLNNHLVSGRIITHILVFLLLYLLLFTLGSIAMSFLGLDFETSLGVVATSLGNVGPAIGDVGPVNTFTYIPDPAKWILCFLMLCGRLELFTVLVLFTPYFWKN